MKLALTLLAFLLFVGCATVPSENPVPSDAVPAADGLDAIAHDYVRLQLEIGRASCRERV